MKQLLIAAAIVAMSGCASNSAVEKNSILLNGMEEHLIAMDARVARLETEKVTREEKDRSQFCYANNMAFSEGSMHLGKVCSRQYGVTVYENGARVPQPMVWR